MPYRGILLDFYGTLVHEDDHIVADICDLIVQTSEMGHRREIVGSTWWDTFCRLTTGSYHDSFLPQRQIAIQSLSETVSHFGADLDANLAIESQFAQWMAPELFPETLSFIEWLSRIGLPVCVVSNIDRADIEAAIGFNGLDLANIITSDDVRAYKPRADIFSAALEVLCLQPAEVLHIGDSRTSDVAGAHGFGIPVAWLNRSGKTPGSGHQPTHTIQNLREVIDLFQ